MAVNDVCPSCGVEPLTFLHDQVCSVCRYRFDNCGTHEVVIEIDYEDWRGSRGVGLPRPKINLVCDVCGLPFKHFEMLGADNLAKLVPRYT